MLVRHKDTVKGFLLMGLRVGREDDALTNETGAVRAAWRDGHGRPGPVIEMGKRLVEDAAYID